MSNINVTARRSMAKKAHHTKQVQQLHQSYNLGALGEYDELITV